MARTQSRQKAQTGHSSITTQNHDEIRRWAEERRGKPATVARTGRGREEAGILRIDFPPYGNQGKLEDISWDEWFQKFDEMGLQFLYQETKADGETSTFNKLVSAESPKSKSSSRSSSSGSSDQANSQAQRSPGSRTASSRSSEGRKTTARKSTSARGKKSASSGRSSSRRGGSKAA